MEQIELKEIFFILKKRFLLIAITTLFATLIAAVASYFIIKPVYKTNISVLIGKQDTASGATGAQLSELTLYQKSVKTYTVLATSRTVAEDVIKKLNLNISVGSLTSMISSTSSADTEFITLTVKSKDPQLAVNVANQLAKSLKEVSKTIKNQDLVQLVDDAVLPTSPISPKPTFNMAIAFLLGLIISTGVVLLLEHFDNTIKSPEDIEKHLGLSVIGSIPLMDNKR